MFERFTNEARRVIVLSQDEARQLKHDLIGTEHLLLGLLGGGDTPESSFVSTEALNHLGIDLASARLKVEELVPTGDHEPSRHIPFTPHAKAVLERGLREALQIGHNYIGTEHLLLGLIREGEGKGTEAIRGLGVELHAVREAVIEYLSRGPFKARKPVDPGVVIRQPHEILSDIEVHNSAVRALTNELRKSLEG